jgi:hypothetical protein
MRPEVERPEPGENEISGKSELEVEFERAEVKPRRPDGRVRRDYGNDSAAGDL